MPLTGASWLCALTPGLLADILGVTAEREHLNRMSNTVAATYVSRAQDRAMVAAYREQIQRVYDLGELIDGEDAFRDALPQQTRAAFDKSLATAKAIELKQHHIAELATFPYNFSPNLLDAVTRTLGITDLWDARKLTPKKLDQVPGFGTVKIQQFQTALLTHSDAIAAKAQVNLNLAAKVKNVETLMRQIYLTRVYGNTVFTSPAIEQISAALADHEPIDEAEIEHLTAWGAFFNPRGKRRNAAREVIAAFLNQYRGLPVEQTIAIVERERHLRTAHQRVDLPALAADYRANVATYQSILAQLAPAPENPAQISGDFGGVGITDELWQRINNFELNLTGFKAFLRPYQQFGVKFIAHQRRTLLGDDTGLGKTLQALALMTHITNSNQNTRYLHLVVSPLSVQRNWIKEIAKHTGLRAIAIESKHQQIDPQQYDIAVTTYERLSDTLRAQVNGAVIVDEAHMAKNPTANRTQRIVSMIKNRTYVLFMTGSAIENKLEELTRLVSVVNPFLAAQLAELGEAPSVQVYKAAIAQAYLRRNKEDVLKELPEITIKDEWVMMGKQETDLYIDALAKGWHAARQASFRAPDSGKVERLHEILNDTVQRGEKTLVFSFYLDTLDRVVSEFPHIPIFRIDGSIPADERQDVVDAFNAHQGAALFLSQIDTGGVGLNLQSASVVVLCEPQLKYSTEMQAYSRAHRMGQLNPVVVHRLITDETVDEGMNDLRNQKADLFDQYANETDLGERSVSLEITAAGAKDILSAQRQVYGVAA